MLYNSPRGLNLVYVAIDAYAPSCRAKRLCLVAEGVSTHAVGFHYYF